MKRLSWLSAVAAVATIVGATATVASVIFLQCGSDVGRRLDLRMLSDVQVTRDLEQVPGTVRLLYNGEEVDRMRLTEVSIRNNGDDDIPTAAFEAPLSLAFSDGAELLVAEVTDRDPADLLPRVSIEFGGITVQPLLMNIDDRFTIRLVSTASPDANLLARGRIQGVPGDIEVQPLSQDDNSGGDTGWLDVTTVAMMISGVMVVLIATIAQFFFTRRL